MSTWITLLRFTEKCTCNVDPDRRSKSAWIIDDFFHINHYIQFRRPTVLKKTQLNFVAEVPPDCQLRERGIFSDILHFRLSSIEIPYEKNSRLISITFVFFSERKTSTENVFCDFY